MLRALLCVGAIAIMALPCRGEATVSGSETLYKLNVSPAPAPTPALRHRLLPDLMEMNPGNPVQGYFRAFMAHQKFLLDEETSGRREKLLAMPLRTLPSREMREYGRLVLIEADRAARLDHPDWQILPGLKTDGFRLLLPDVQQLRSLANAVKVRFRAEVAMGQFDDAIRSAKTIFAISRHLGEHPTIIGNLVGIAVAYTALGALEEMLEQPGCPNLFWALTTLPAPFISVATGMEGERTLLRTEFRDLDDQAPMDAGQIKRFGEHWDEILATGQSAEKWKGVQGWLNERTKDDVHPTAARRRLVESGLPAEQLSRFPAAQVLLLDEQRECQARFDDVMKTMALPLWIVESQGVRPSLDKEITLFSELLMFTTPARRAQGRLEQRIALLRHVEALRLHAAENRGALPAKLSEMTVPLPDDPFTGKPFSYELRDGTAHLRGCAPKGEEANPAFNIHFSVTLQE